VVIDIDKIKEAFRLIIQFLSNNFEILMAINISIIFMFLLVLIALKLREVDFNRVAVYMMNIIVMCIQAFFLVLFTYLYWINYKSPAEVLDFSKMLSSNTHWVKQNFRIYFIKDNQLKTVGINGSNPKVLLTTNEPIREYDFSPDGRYLLVSSPRELYCMNLKTGKWFVVESLLNTNNDTDLHRGISSLQWSPDSRHFCYVIARWSKYSDRHNMYIYDLTKNRRQQVKGFFQKQNVLYWDRKGENIYFFHYKLQDTSIQPYAYEIIIYRISLTKLTPEFVAEIPSREASLPIEQLAIRHIKLFLNGERFIFSKFKEKDCFISENGSYIGIDDKDNLYFVKNKWFRKRLYKITRRPVISDIPRYQYRGGDLTLKNFRWIPGGHYVIMQHTRLGIIILEPATARIGILIEADGDTFGWYDRRTTICKNRVEDAVSQMPKKLSFWDIVWDLLRFNKGEK